MAGCSTSGPIVLAAAGSGWGEMRGGKRLTTTLFDMGLIRKMEFAKLVC